MGKRASLIGGKESTCNAGHTRSIPGLGRSSVGSSLRSPAEGEGHEGFPPPPDKDLESPSSTRLEAPPAHPGSQTST